MRHFELMHAIYIYQTALPDVNDTDGGHVR